MEQYILLKLPVVCRIGFQTAVFCHVACLWFQNQIMGEILCSQDESITGSSHLQFPNYFIVFIYIIPQGAKCFTEKHQDKAAA